MININRHKNIKKLLLKYKKQNSHIKFDSKCDILTFMFKNGDEIIFETNDDFQNNKMTIIHNDVVVDIINFNINDDGN